MPHRSRRPIGWRSPERLPERVEVAPEQAPHQRIDVGQLGGVGPDDERRGPVPGDPDSAPGLRGGIGAEPATTQAANVVPAVRRRIPATTGTPGPGVVASPPARGRSDLVRQPPGIGDEVGGEQIIRPSRAPTGAQEGDQVRHRVE